MMKGQTVNIVFSHNYKNATYAPLPLDQRLNDMDF